MTGSHLNIEKGERDSVRVFPSLQGHFSFTLILVAPRVRETDKTSAHKEV